MYGKGLEWTMVTMSYIIFSHVLDSVFRQFVSQEIKGWAAFVRPEPYQFFINFISSLVFRTLVIAIDLLLIGVPGSVIYQFIDDLFLVDLCFIANRFLCPGINRTHVRLDQSHLLVFLYNNGLCSPAAGNNSCRHTRVSRTTDEYLGFNCFTYGRPGDIRF